MPSAALGAGQRPGPALLLRWAWSPGTGYHAATCLPARVAERPAQVFDQAPLVEGHDPRAADGAVALYGLGHAPMKAREVRADIDLELEGCGLRSGLVLGPHLLLYRWLRSAARRTRRRLGT